jgi:hypothetical protein
MLWNEIVSSKKLKDRVEGGVRAEAETERSWTRNKNVIFTTMFSHFPKKFFKQQNFGLGIGNQNYFNLNFIVREFLKFSAKFRNCT